MSKYRQNIRFHKLYITPKHLGKLNEKSWKLEPFTHYEKHVAGWSNPLHTTST